MFYPTPGAHPILEAHQQFALYMGELLCAQRKKQARQRQEYDEETQAHHQSVLTVHGHQEFVVIGGRDDMFPQELHGLIGFHICQVVAQDEHPL